MNTRSKKPSDFAFASRRRAEQHLETTGIVSAEMDSGAAPEAPMRKLRLHQVELEIQNKELRCALNELKRARDRFADLYDNAPAGYVTISRDGQILEANLTIARMLGVKRAILHGKRFYRFVVKAQQHEFFSHHRALFETHDPQTCELSLVRAGGSVFEARLESALQAGVAGELSACRTLITDVGVRKQAENSWRLADAVIEATGEGILVLDKSGVIVRANRAFAAAAGYELRQLHGHAFRDMLAHERDRKMLDRAYVRLQRDYSWCGELTVRRAGGGSFPVRASFTIILGSNGETPHLAGVITDVTETKRLQEQMHRRAHYDSITDLPNRTLFAECLSQAAKETQRNGTMLALLYLDLDCFKPINDMLGHAAGDTLLREVAFRLSACVRECDTVARVGGDEFAIILPEVRKTEDAAAVARKINAALSAPIRVREGADVPCGASIGVAVYPLDTRDLEVLLHYADMAMYRAKMAGRNAHCLFNASMTCRLAAPINPISVERELGRALQRNEFVLRYQPIVHANSGDLVGTEALIRWQHPSRGLLSPEFFRAVAEDSGHITPLGEWVLRAACTEVSGWPVLDDGSPPPFVSINVSARQLGYPPAFDRLIALLKQVELPPERINIEITESVSMGADNAVMEGLRSLKNLGVRLVMDDFGTGYSSLSCLKRLPFDVVKIDRSFVSDVASDADAARLVESVIDMAHGLRLTVVGEGVETQSQLDFLRKCRCDYVQGYFIGPPVSADLFVRRLSSGSSYWD